MKQVNYRSWAVLCSTIALAFLTHGMRAQSIKGEPIPSISFTDSVYNFGLVAEEKGPVGCIFSFTNTGEAPLVITNASADCGCTSPTYTLEAINPGEQGEVRVSYNPEGRPGSFIKKIRVYSNAGEYPKELVIKGNVTTLGGNERNRYQLQVGELLVSNKHLAFPIVTAQEESTIRLVVNNPSAHPIKVRFLKIPKFVSLNKNEFVLAPNEPEELYLTALVSEKDRPEIRQGILRIEARDERNGQNVRADISLTMPLVNKQLAILGDTAPKMELVTYFDFGEHPKGKTIKGTIKIENKGNAPLEIYSIVPYHKAISIKASRKVIEAGQYGELIYKIDMRKVAEQGGKLSQNIDLLVNDPYGPLRKIRFMATIKE